MLSATASCRIAVTDDGVGMGQSSSAGGADEGLAPHSTTMAVISGALIADPAGERGIRVIVTLLVDRRENWVM